MAKILPLLAGLGVIAAASVAVLIGVPSSVAKQAGSGETACANDESGLSLPPGFCATIFADNIGHARHMAVAPDGTLYVNTWMSRYFRTPPPEGGFIVGLRDRDGDGKA